ncbi:MAG: BrnT family toxin [Elusimicrobia bacterium]|nr:BrnT family toxin [Candidatus Liberimonas magnetica]
MNNNILESIEGFEWDKFNIEKILQKHKVIISECEEVFLNDHILGKDVRHSLVEDRYYLFGSSNNERLLTVIFTIRGKRIRVISARKMSKKERLSYHEKIKRTTKIQD